MDDSKYIYIYELESHKIIGFLELSFKNDIMKVYICVYYLFFIELFCKSNRIDYYKSKSDVYI